MFHYILQEGLSRIMSKVDIKAMIKGFNKNELKDFNEDIRERIETLRYQQL